jgi:hypothetical protein
MGKPLLRTVRDVPGIAWVLDRLRYDPKSGNIYVKKKKTPISVTEDGYCYIFHPVQKKNVKFSMDRLVWFLVHNEIPLEGQKVLHKNLNKKDYRLSNLCLITRELYRKINEAYNNLMYDIKITQHPKDQYCCIVHWKDEGSKQKVFSDVISANKFLLRLKLKNAKFLTQYCVFN